MSVLYLLLFLLLLSLAYAGFLFAPWVPTHKKDIERIQQLIDAKPGHIVYELGSGTGHVAIALAQNKEITIKGVELVFPLFLFATIRAKIQQSQVQFYWKNFFKMDLSDASRIYLFGTPKPLAKKLRVKFEQECKPGTKIISYVFAFPDWDPVFVSKPTENDLSIYVYEMKTT